MCAACHQPLFWLRQSLIAPGCLYTVWVWGVDGLGFQSRIDSYYSTNLQEWINGTAFEIKNATEVGFSGIANNAVTRLDTPKGEPPAYVMSIESNGGPLVGKAFLMATFAYLNSSNLSSGWTQFPPATHHYTSHEYSACPTIRSAPPFVLHTARFFSLGFVLTPIALVPGTLPAGSTSRCSSRPAAATPPATSRCSSARETCRRGPGLRCPICPTGR